MVRWKPTSAGVGVGPGSGPEQPGDDGAVEGGARPAGQVGHNGFVQEWADDGKMRSVGEPEAHRLGVDEPVGVELRKPGEGVDNGELGSQGPDDAGGDVGVSGNASGGGVE